MAKLPRVTAKVFASKAASNDIGQYGSALTGTKVTTGDIAEIQALPAYEVGWRGAVISGRNYPTLPETNGLQKTFSQQIAYLFQEGIPEYDAGTTYYIGSIVKNLEDNKVVLYQSITDNNTGNPLTNTDNWEKVELGGGGSSTGGFNLFDLVLKDHILSFDESKGFALLGTYVYKTGVSGTRYGYPDFYNRCVEEYNNSTLDSPQQVKYTIQNGQIVFKKGSIFKIPNGFEADGTTPKYEYVTLQEDKPYTLPSIVNSFPYTGYIAYSITGSLYIWNSTTTNTSATSGFIFNESQNIVTSGSSTGIQCSFPLLKATFTNNTTVSTVNTVYQGNDFLEVSPTSAPYFPTKRNANKHIFYDIAYKSAVDNIYNSTGVAWFYGVDTENERIFLPRKDFVSITPKDTLKIYGDGNCLLLTADNSHFGALGTYSNYNSSNTAGLSNTGSVKIGATVNGNVGDVYRNKAMGVPTKMQLNNKGWSSGLKTGAFSPEQDYYVYMVVGNTEQESAITNVVDVTTSENDTIPLGYSTYQANAQSSVSWLASNGQWNSGNVYTTFYNYYVTKIGEAFADGFVKEHTDTYDDYDLVINQTDMTFRLPLLNGSEDLLSNKHDNLTLGASDDSYTAPANGWYYVQFPSENDKFIDIYNRTTQSGIISSSASANTSIRAMAAVNKGDKVGIRYTATGAVSSFKFIYAKGNGTLYFKVDNAVQNLELMDAGAITQTLATKTDMAQAAAASMPSSKYINLTLGASGDSYTAPADGFFTIAKVTGTTSHTYCDLYNVTANLALRSNNSGSSSTAHSIYIPVAKGDNVVVNYNATGNTNRFRFVYAKGAQND